jgi:hypothetical protein|tara:strand:- start:947 stop:1594 length:648 start_codon:yes stop_codon:yes gene_type:complete
MNNQHKQHKYWSPVRKLYYKKYYNVIRASATPTHSAVSIPLEFKGEYRIVDRYDGIKKIDGATAFTSVASIYTNNQDLINYVMKTYGVIGIETPFNQTHLDYLLDSNREIIYRDKAWYDQYHHKVRVFESWRSRGLPNSAQPIEVLTMWKELFQRKDSRWSGQDRQLRTSWSHSRYFSYPTVYTNNEASIMLLKMTYNSLLNIHVETVVTPDFLK